MTEISYNMIKNSERLESLNPSRVTVSLILLLPIVIFSDVINQLCSSVILSRIDFRIFRILDF